MMNARFDAMQLAAIVASLPDPALIVDARSLVLAANEPAQRFFEGNPVDRHLSFAIRAPAVLQAVNAALQQGEAGSVLHVVRTPVARNFDVRVAPLGFSANAIRIVLLSLRDLTKEENVERMRSDFVANASHELRTPLASISGFIETMQGPAKNDDKAKEEFLRVMKAQADRMALLIDDLLSLSRIEMSEHLQPHETADLVQITHQACTLLKTLAKENDCELRLDLPDTLMVTGDSNQLSQVVHNLIENAIKYGGSGQVIEIEGRSYNNSVILSVSDHGPGIAAHHVPRLTERFYRVNVQDSRNRGGTGLGLAIAKHIINRHRGRLEIISKIGTGSRFSIHLPAKT
jgi:two-component system, OmpR family, phosphate regulon sensor histidine kinase PhoR